MVGPVPSGPNEMTAVWPQPHYSTCLLERGVLGTLSASSQHPEYPDNQLFEGMNFIRSAVFL